MAYPNQAACRRLKSAIAFESGNIQGVAERYIAETHNYLVNKIPQSSYDLSVGEDPRKIRYSTAPIEDRPYIPLLVNGDESNTMPARNCAGYEEDITTTINKKGSAGCHLPGQTIHGGYDVFYREVKGKAWETDTICALDLLTKEHYNAYIRMLRTDLPRRAVEQFEYSLEREVVSLARYNTSIVNGFTWQDGAFPAIPEGMLDLGYIRRLFQILEAQGWEGAYEVQTSVQAFENMRLNYKRNTGMELQTTVNSTETQYLDKDEMSVQWAGITWVLKKNPTRGYLVQKNTGYEFVPVRPTKARAGTGGGVVIDVNEDYFNCWTYCQGERHELFELGFYISPKAATRMSFAVPQVDTKKFSQNAFNFEVEMIDGAYIPCNEDNFMFYHRMKHAYGIESLWPELMGAVIYRIQPDQIHINTPVCTNPCVDADGITIAQPEPLQHDACSLALQENDCSDEVAEAFLPVPTEDQPFPTPIAGNLRFVNAGPIVTELDAGNLSVWVERIGGVSGAAGVTLTPTNGTATGGDDFTNPGATALTWADGEAGKKKITIPILDTGDANTEFTVASSAVSGAAWVGVTSVTVQLEEACTPYEV